MPVPTKRLRSMQRPLAVEENEDTGMKNAANRDRPAEPHVEDLTKKAKIDDEDRHTRTVEDQAVALKKWTEKEQATGSQACYFTKKRLFFLTENFGKSY